METKKPITHDELNKTSSITDVNLPTYKSNGIVENVKYITNHPLSYLTLSDLISLHGWIDDDADLIEALGGDNTAKLEKAREQMVLVHQEIEKRRVLIFGEQ